MSATPETRTRALARTIGPFLVIVPTLVAYGKVPVATMVSAFFANAALVLISGALVLLLGLLIIANHWVWSSPPAIVVSLIGCLLALRGVVQLVAPGWATRAAAAILDVGWVIPIVAGILALVGFWLCFVGWGPERS